MPELPGKAWLTSIYLPVYDNTYAQPPAYVDKQDVFFPVYTSLYMLSVGHGPSIIVYAYRISYLLFQYLC